MRSRLKSFSRFFSGEEQGPEGNSKKKLSGELEKKSCRGNSKQEANQVQNKLLPRD